MTDRPLVVVRGAVPSRFEDALAALGYAVARTWKPSMLPVCTIAGTGDPDLASWRADPRAHLVPLLVLVERLDTGVLREALAMGADDVILVSDVEGLLRRVNVLRGAERPELGEAQVVLVVDEDEVRRGRIGGALRRSGLSTVFAASLDEVDRGLRPAAAVVHRAADPLGSLHHDLRWKLDFHGLPIVVMGGSDADDFGGRSSPTTAVVPADAPADHLVFMLHELLHGAAELRASQRLLFSTLCSFRPAGEVLPSYGLTYNISRDGIFVQTLEPVDEDAVVWLEFRPPHSEVCVHVRGVVAWRRTSPGATPAGFAIQLVPHRCPEEDLERYREHYRRLLEQPRVLESKNVARAPDSPCLLIADDEEVVLRAMRRIFRDMDFEIITAKDGKQAVELFRQRRPDAVLTDINMPGLNGLDLLKAIKADDVDVPVIVTTGAPSMDTAIAALEFGAFRYIQKPVDPAEVRNAMVSAVRMARLAKYRREAAQHVAAATTEDNELEELDQRLTRAVELLFAHYQPIVVWPEREIFAYEALVRTKEPSIPHPGVLFDAAETLQRVQDVGRQMRLVAPEPFKDGGTPLLFINLHPSDLLDEDLFDPSTPLGCIASKVVLEITERASLSGIGELRERIDRLRALGFRIAVDDLGAGYAGLSAFVALQPDVVKLDMSLVRDIHESPTKQRLVQSVVDACGDLEMQVIAEGVETAGELLALEKIGCRLFQGYYFARPGLPFPEPVWPAATDAR